MSQRAVSLQKRGDIAYLTLASPERANRIGVDAVMELGAACVGLADDDAIRCVVIAGAGEHFSAGWDADALSGDVAALAEAFTPVAALPQPVIAALHGDVISAGLELALACDIRIAAEGARFALPEAEYGLLPLAGGAARLPRLIGKTAATELLLTGRIIDTAEALRVGLVSRVVPGGQLIAEAERMANVIAQRGPIATRFAKEAIHRGVDLPMDQALRFETDLTVILQTTEDRAEGVRAFKEKRPPTFRGR